MLFRLLGFRDKIIIPITLLFAIHPMHVESVAWIAEQKDLLYALFFLASLISYLLFIKNDKQVKWIVISLIFFIFSLLSKSMAVTLPLILLIFDWYLGRLKSGKILLEKLPYFILSLLFGIMAIISQTQGGATQIVPDFSIIDRFFLASYAIVFYLYKVIAPLNLSVIHYYPEKIDGILKFQYYMMPLVIIVIMYFIRKLKPDRKILLFGSLFFLASVSVILQLIPVGEAIVAERYTYIAYLGLFLIVSYYFNKVTEWKKPSLRKIRPIIYVLATAYLVFICILTYQRIKVWEDGISLFSDVIQKNPDNFHSYHVIGNAYSAKNEYPKALENYNKAIDLNDQHMESFMNRGYARMQSGKNQEAIEDFNKVIQMMPDYYQAYTNRGIVYNRLEDYTNALDNYNKALSINPDDVISMSERAQLYFDQDRNEEALTDLTNVINIDKNYSDAYSIRGVHYAQNGKYDEAVTDLRRAMELDPLNTNIYINLANTLTLMDDYLGAIEILDKAIDISQFNLIAYGNRGIAKLKLNLTKEACKDFQKAANMGHQKSRELLNRYCQ